MDKVTETVFLEEMLISRADEKRMPISATWELLPLCNMNCDMCYVRLSREEMETQGCLRTADEWLEIARQMKNSGTLFVLLTGGEPLMYPEFKKLYLALQEMGMIVSINTNGTLLNSEWAEFFGKHKPQRINITLYGGSEETYKRLCHYPEGYEKTVRAIQLLKENKVDVKINYSVTSENEHETEAIITLAKELNIPIIIDTYMIPIKRERKKEFDMQSRLSPNEAAEIRIKCWKLRMGMEGFEEYAKKIVGESEKTEKGVLKHSNSVFCHAGKSSFTITWSGKMQPCLTLEKIRADVFEVGFETAWNYIVRETEKIKINFKCVTCSYRPVCRTCAACAIAETGEYMGIPDYMCEYAKKSFDLIS